jgi:neutral ceramidase
MQSYTSRLILLAVSIPFLACGRAPVEEPASGMRAGVAKVVISNQTPRVLTAGPVSTGILKDIHARALVLNDGTNRLVIITYDLNCLDHTTPFLRSRLKKELDLEPANLILLATHNHNGPIQIVPDNFDYGRRLADQLVDLVKEAIANERGPVNVLFGSGNGYFIESTGNAPVDYEIQVLKVVRDGRPLALLFNHGTHPLQASRDKVEPGHPGWAMDEIEARLPGVQAMYGTAAGGNQFPRVRGKLRQLILEARADPAAVDTTLIDPLLEEHTRALGRELAEVVIQIAQGPLRDVTGPLTTKMEVLSLPLAPPIPREEAENLAREFPPDVGLVPYPSPHRGTNWVRMLLDWYDRGIPFPTRTTDMICTDDTYLIHKSDEKLLAKYAYSIHDEFPCVYEEVIVAKIGPMPLVAMQGEVVAPIGMRIKDAFRYDMPIMVFAYMGEHNLYIPTREIVRQDVYQSRVIQIQYASPVGWAPEVEDEMVNGVIGLVRTVVGQ